MKEKGSGQDLQVSTFLELDRLRIFAILGRGMSVFFILPLLLGILTWRERADALILLHSSVQPVCSTKLGVDPSFAALTGIFGT
jgi:hypothetical protein